MVIRLRKPSWISTGITYAGFASLVVFVNVAFPKGGFYLGDIPVTWGYILLGVGAALVLGQLIIRRYTLTTFEIIQFSLLSIFLIYNVITLALTGFNESLSKFSEVASYLIAISVVPSCTILTVGMLAKRRGIQPIVEIWEPALWVIFLWGIVTFVSYNFMRDNTPAGIPFVTLTGSDPAGLLDRNINRGVVIKMVSTYNNGSILGTNMLIWLPLLLYSNTIKSKISAIIARVAIFLTFARAAWFGLIIMEFLCLAFYKKRIRFVLVALVALPIVFAVIVLTAGLFFEDPLAFIFNPNLGGRTINFELLPIFGLAPQPFIQVMEIVHLSMMGNLGALGVLIYYCTWFFPLLVPVKDRESKLAKIGLATYFLVSFMEGAFIYIPTQFTYWMIAALILSRASWNLKRDCSEDQ